MTEEQWLEEIRLCAKAMLDAASAATTSNVVILAASMAVLKAQIEFGRDRIKTRPPADLERLRKDLDRSMENCVRAGLKVTNEAKTTH